VRAAECLRRGIPARGQEAVGAEAPLVRSPDNKGVGLNSCARPNACDAEFLPAAKKPSAQKRRSSDRRTRKKSD